MRQFPSLSLNSWCLWKFLYRTFMQRRYSTSESSEINGSLQSILVVRRVLLLLRVCSLTRCRRSTEKSSRFFWRITKYYEMTSTKSGSTSAVTAMIPSNIMTIRRFLLPRTCMNIPLTPSNFPPCMRTRVPFCKFISLGR